MKVEILGVNQISDAQYNSIVSQSFNILPWLQDTSEQNVRGRWKAVYRDVVILDALNRPVGSYNLTANDLGIVARRQTLKQMMLATATAAATDSDKDGLMDLWETFWFGSLASTASEDSDGDRLSNGAEFTFGSSPRDPKSGLTVRPWIVRPAGRQALTLTFKRYAGSAASFVVESSQDLITWTSNPSALVPIGSPVNLYDGFGSAETRYQQTSTAGAHPAGFIRVRYVGP